MSVDKPSARTFGELFKEIESDGIIPVFEPNKVYKTLSEPIMTKEESIKYKFIKRLVTSLVEDEDMQIRQNEKIYNTKTEIVYDMVLRDDYTESITSYIRGGIGNPKIIGFHYGTEKDKLGSIYNPIPNIDLYEYKPSRLLYPKPITSKRIGSFITRKRRLETWLQVV